MTPPRLWLLIACLFAFAAPAGAELTADNLLLVVNKNVPAGVELAEYYADARKVPDGRILALDLPDGDDMKADAYDRNVAEAIRQHLEAQGLEEQVTCIVTF